jgi:hypothetical protein
MVCLSYESALAATSMTLRFRTADGEPARVTRAELLVTAWGVSEEQPLPVRDDVVVLDLEATRPEFADRFADERGYVYIEADGHVPVISQAFEWPSAERDAVIIDFRRGRERIVRFGESASLDVVLQKVQPRSIRVIDQANRPIAGLEIAVALNWNAPNHCGFLNGRKDLATRVTDSRGILRVPDVDGTYALTIIERRTVFVDATTDFGQIVTPLTDTETTLEVRRYERHGLTMEVLQDGKAVSNAVLWADMGLGACGASHTILGVSDTAGRVEVREYYPEEWRNFWLCVNDTPVWVQHDLPLPPKLDVGSASGTVPRDFAMPCRQSRYRE